MDFDSRLGRKTLIKLKRESMVWLTTVDAGGRPQPRPVWFHWGGRDILLFSPLDAAKVRQIAANANASIHFNADRDGTDVVVLLGRARRVRRISAERRAAYLRKYRGNMKDPQSFQARFSVPILFRPTTLRGH
jgi:PPOX class probable F420-dependent enzyme